MVEQNHCIELSRADSHSSAVCVHKFLCAVLQIFMSLLFNKIVGKLKMRKTLVGGNSRTRKEDECNKKTTILAIVLNVQNLSIVINLAFLLSLVYVANNCEINLIIQAI